MAELRRVPLKFEATILKDDAVIPTRQGKTYPESGEILIIGTGDETYPIVPDVMVVNYEPADVDAVEYLRKYLPASIGQEATDEYLVRCDDRATRLREALADLEHQQWAHWMTYLFDLYRENDDGSVTIPADAVRRWGRLAETGYDDLSEAEQEADQEWADRVIETYHRVYDE